MVSNKTPEWLTAIFTAGLAMTGAFALIYAHWQLREAHEEAQVQHLVSFDQQYRQEPMVSYRKNYAKKRLAGVEDPPEEMNLLDFFETIGLLVNRGYLNGTDVWETFSSEVIPLRADARSFLDQEQKKDPTEYSNFTQLANLMESIDHEHHGTLSKPSNEDMQEFWNDEVATEVNSPMPKHKQQHRVVAPR